VLRDSRCGFIRADIRRNVGYVHVFECKLGLRPTTFIPRVRNMWVWDADYITLYGGTGLGAALSVAREGLRRVRRGHRAKASLSRGGLAVSGVWHSGGSACPRIALRRRRPPCHLRTTAPSSRDGASGLPAAKRSGELARSPRCGKLTPRLTNTDMRSPSLFLHQVPPYNMPIDTDVRSAGFRRPTGRRSFSRYAAWPKASGRA
jgi:hypothetical protein